MASVYTSGRIAMNVTIQPAAVYPGKLFCAAFLNKGNITSVGQVVAKGTSVSYLAGADLVNIAMSGLQALSPYESYCYLETSLGKGNSIAEVKATRTLHRTACCKEIAFSNAPSVLYLSLIHI